MYSKYFEKKLAVIALSLGLFATLGSLLIVLGVNRVTFTEIEKQYQEFSLAKARSYAALLAPNQNIPTSIQLEYVQNIWQHELDLPADEFICILDDQSRVILHSADPSLVGQVLNAQLSEGTHTPNTLAKLVQGSREYVGTLLSNPEEPLITAFTPVIGRPWFLGIHRSQTAVAAHIAAELNSQKLALLAISLGIIPLTLGFLYFSFLRINGNRAKAEQALLESVKALGPVLQHAVDPIYRYNLITRRYDYFSPSCRNTHGYSSRELVNRGIETSRIHPEDLENLQQQFRGQRTEKLAPDSFQSVLEYRFKHKTLGYRWLSDSRSILHDSRGRPIAIVGSIRDITAHKLTETSLRKSERINRSITENAADAIITIDTQGLVLSWNQAATDMFGYTDNEMVNQQFSVILPTQFSDGQISATKQPATPDQTDFQTNGIRRTARRKDGSEFHIEFSLSSWKSEDRQYYTAIIRDITRREQAQTELFQALEEAKTANNVKDQFIANISHEIRTPLTSITGFLELIKSSLKDNEEVFSFFRFIDHSTERLLRTVDSILNISQLKTRKVTLKPQALQLSALSQQICDELQSGAQSKGLFLKFRSSVADDTVILDDPSMYQAISNIIHNAIKYTQTGGVTVRLQHTDKQLSLTVSDTGIGISEVYLLTMFEPFSQESEGFTKDFQGIGLGLALTKQYLDLNGVQLRVTSEKGQGSSFRMLFPGKWQAQHVS